MDPIPPKVPIHHALPTELLAVIFKAGAFMPTYFMARPFPLLVSSICRHWREVVISSPDVWTNIHWYVGSSPFPALWFERSKSCLLDITIHAFLFNHELDASLLIPYIDRCRRLIIGAGDANDLLEVIGPLRDTFSPRLKHIELYVIYGDSEVEEVTQQHFLTGGTPELCSVKLYNVSLQHTPTLVGVQTLSLHKWRPSPTEFRLLATAFSLKELVLHECMVIKNEAAHTYVEIPSLVSLAISHVKSPSFYSTKPYLSLLTYLLLPNLEYLEIVHATFLDIVSHFPIGCQERHYPKLQTLRLDRLHLGESNMQDRLPRALPTVSHLQLINTEGERILPTKSTFIMSSLMKHDATSSMAATTVRMGWPNLHTITLKSSLVADLDWLRDMAWTRDVTGNPLSRVCILDDPRGDRLSAVYGTGTMEWIKRRFGVVVVSEDEMLGIIQPEDQNEDLPR